MCIFILSEVKMSICIEILLTKQDSMNSKLNNGIHHTLEQSKIEVETVCSIYSDPSKPSVINVLV